MGPYYKPSMSTDPWANLQPRLLQPEGQAGPGAWAGAQGQGQGQQHAVNTRRLGGVSLPDIMAASVEGEGEEEGGGR